MEELNELKNNKQDENRIEATGWDSISNAFDEIYPNQKNPKHYGTLIKWSLGEIGRASCRERV